MYASCNLNIKCSIEKGSVVVMVSAVDCRLSGPGSNSSAGWGHCVVFLGKTLYSHSVSPQGYTIMQMATSELFPWVNLTKCWWLPAMD